MKKFEIITLVLLLFSTISNLKTYSQTPDYVWAKSGGGSDWDKGSAICLDHAGNILVTGTFSSTATFSGQSIGSKGMDDMFLAKYNSNGDLTWIKTAGGAGPETGAGVAVDKNNNIFITGSFNYTLDFGTQQLVNNGNSYDIFLAKYNKDGNLLWAKKAGGTGADMSYGITIDNQGNVIIVGVLQGTGSFDTITLSSKVSYNHFFVAKYDNNGHVLFAESFGGRMNTAKCVATDNNDNIIVAGGYRDTLILGGKTHIAKGNSDPFLIKLNSNGNELWSSTPSGAGNSDQFNGVCTDNNGNIYLAGTFANTLDFETGYIDYEGGVDAFYCKFDSNGVFKWVRGIGGTDFDQALSIHCNNQNIFVTGFTKVIPSQGCDVFVLKSDLIAFSSEMMVNGDIFDDYGRAVCADRNGNFFVTGEFNQTIKFDSTTLSGQSFEMFVAKYGFAKPPSIIILLQPQSEWKCVGNTVTFNISAIGKNLDYQWNFNDIEITGAIDTFFTISNLAMTDTGEYSCVVSDSSTSIISNLALLWIGAGPKITQHPQAKTVEKGKPASFSVTASGSGLLYKWQKNGVDIKDADQSVLSFNNVQFSDSGRYRCLVFDMCGVDTTNEVLLKVIKNTGIHELSEAQISIFPNPAKEFIRISFTDWVTEPLTIRLFRSDGKLVKEQIITEVNITMIEFSVNGMDEGIYFIQITNDKINFSKRIFVH